MAARRRCGSPSRRRRRHWRRVSLRDTLAATCRAARNNNNSANSALCQLGANGEKEKRTKVNATGQCKMILIDVVSLLFAAPTHTHTHCVVACVLRAAGQFSAQTYKPNYANSFLFAVRKLARAICIRRDGHTRPAEREMSSRATTSPREPLPASTCFPAGEVLSCCCWLCDRRTDWRTLFG